MKFFMLIVVAILICVIFACALEDGRERESEQKWLEFSASHHCQFKSGPKSSWVGEQRNLWQCDGFEIFH